MPSRPNGQLVAAHLAESTATFATRRAAQACYGCDVDGQLAPNQPEPHWEIRWEPEWECKLHGAGASAFSRGNRDRGPEQPLRYRASDVKLFLCGQGKGRRDISILCDVRWLRPVASCDARGMTPDSLTPTRSFPHMTPRPRIFDGNAFLSQKSIPCGKRAQPGIEKWGTI